jgi:hypothetical protein
VVASTWNESHCLDALSVREDWTRMIIEEGEKRREGRGMGSSRQAEGTGRRTVAQGREGQAETKRRPGNRAKGRRPSRGKSREEMRGEEGRGGTVRRGDQEMKQVGRRRVQQGEDGDS